MEITVQNLKDIRKRLIELNISPVKYYQIHLIRTWQLMRDHKNFCFAKWTDEELKNHDKDNGFIGNKCGVGCYVSILI